MLKKLCNTPQLLNLPDELPGSEGLLPNNFVSVAEKGASSGRGGTSSRSRGGGGGGGGSEVHSEWSGKFAVLERYDSYLFNAYRGYSNTPIPQVHASSQDTYQG